MEASKARVAAMQKELASRSTPTPLEHGPANGQNIGAYGIYWFSYIRLNEIVGWPCLGAGAPAMETSSGVFVAGNAAHTLGTLPTEGLGKSRESLVSESSAMYESGWRYEQHRNEKQQDKQDKQDGMETGDPRAEPKDTISDSPKESETKKMELAGENGRNDDALPEGKGTTEGTGERETPRSLDGREGSEDEIPLGFSPGSTPSLSEPPVNNNKYDKYYHQNLICTKYIHTYIYVSI